LHLYRSECDNLALRCGLGNCEGRPPDTCFCFTFYIVSTPDRYIEDVWKILYQKGCNAVSALYAIYFHGEGSVDEYPTWAQVLDCVRIPEPISEWAERPIWEAIAHYVQDLGAIQDEEIRTLIKFQVLTLVPEGAPDFPE